MMLRGRVGGKARAKPSESPAAAKSPRANLDNLGPAINFLHHLVLSTNLFSLSLSSTQRQILRHGVRVITYLRSGTTPNHERGRLQEALWQI